VSIRPIDMAGDHNRYITETSEKEEFKYSTAGV
jgi:hypothetical protein